MRTSLLAVVAVLALSSLATTGCKRLAEKAAEKAEEKAIERAAGGGQVHINDQNGSVTMVTDAGTVTLGTGAQVPEDFPKEIPIYPGAKPTMAVKSSQGSKPVWSVALETTDAKEKVAAYYKSNLSGFTQKSTMDMGAAVMSVYESAKFDVSLTANGQGPKTEILLNVSGR